LPCCACGDIWYVILCEGIASPFIIKKATGYADAAQAAYAYVFVEGLVMIGLWLAYFAIRRPLPAAVMFSRAAWQSGAVIGVITSAMVGLRVMSLYYADNPAYATAVSFLDSAIILFVYALLKRKSDSNVSAGIGMVACAAALIFLQSYI
jgi:hypothetical protein